MTAVGAVVGVLLEGARWLSEGRAPVKIAAKGAITQARARLGPEVMPRLYEDVARPMATANTKGPWFRGRRVVSLDRTTST